MRCKSCGSPLEAVDTECAFCGLEVSLAPDAVASVPVEHQRGEGVELGKTRQDSLREISRGLEKAAQGERRSRALHSYLPKVIVCLLVLGVFGTVINLIVSTNYESTLEGGMLAIRSGEYDKARGFLNEAEAMWGSVDGEPNFYRGVSFFVEAQNSKKDSRQLFAKARDAFGKSRIENSDRPHAYLYQAALDVMEGHPTLAEDHLQKCLEANEGDAEPYHRAANQMKGVLTTEGIPTFYSTLQTGAMAVPPFKQPENGFELPAAR